MNNYKKTYLSNKIPLLTVPIKGALTATALIMFKTGSRYENKRNNGLSHFLEHMFFKGTVKRPNTLTISSELDSLGGEYNAFTSKEFTGYWVKVAAGKLTVALDIISDMLLNSRLAAEEIEREKGVIIEELNMYEDNPIMHVEDVFETVLYGDTPAGWETVGTKANIRRFTRSDFLKYLRAQYGAASAYIILAGGVKDSDKKAAVRMFAPFTANAWKNQPGVKERQVRPQLRTVVKKIDQVNLSLGVRTFPLGHPQEMSVRLLAVILGGSMSSRLFIRLRERNGLAYSIRTLAEFYHDSGYLTAQAGVPIEKTAAAIRIILDEYKKIAAEPVTAAELKRAKDLLNGKMLIQMEATDNLAVWYGRQAVLRQEILTPREFLQRLNRISAIDLLRTAKKIFVNERLNLALIGDIKEGTIKKILHF
jgi:predicted Zn-dependent peptidase